MRITSRFLYLLLFLTPLLSLAGEEDSALLFEQEELVDPKPEASPPRLSSDPYQKNFIKTLSSALFLILCVILASYLFRRFVHNRPLLTNQRKHIKILERRPLSPSTQLYMIQIGTQHFILAESKLEVRTIATLDTVKENVPSNT